MSVSNKGGVVLYNIVCNVDEWTFDYPRVVLGHCGALFTVIAKLINKEI